MYNLCGEGSCMVWYHFQPHYFLFSIIPCGPNFRTMGISNSPSNTKCFIAPEVNVVLISKRLNS